MVKRVEDVHDPKESPSPKTRAPLRAFIATHGVFAPFGSFVSLAVTEKDTVVVFSSAKKYA
jgi:hypothetical protein